MEIPAPRRKITSLAINREYCQLQIKKAERVDDLPFPDLIKLAAFLNGLRSSPDNAPSSIPGDDDLEA